jgi:hypothetical protein
MWQYETEQRLWFVNTEDIVEAIGTLFLQTTKS